MKRSPVLCLILLAPLFVAARRIAIGSGSGSVVKNDMQGLDAGDTLAIRPGFYQAGGSLSHLSGITIVNGGGPVRFGNTISLSFLSRVTVSGSGAPGLVYGFRFRNLLSTAFMFEGPCRELTISGCEYQHCGGDAFEASRPFITYRGDSATLGLYRVRITRQKLVHSGALFVGPFAENPSFQNVIDSISFTNIIIDSTEAEGSQLISASIYRMLVSDWRFTGPTINGKQDIGILHTTGNGTVRNFYRRGGWGYLWRAWNVGLNGRGESWMYNCIDLSSDSYGTLDTRVNADDTSTGIAVPFCRGGNMHVFNNTTGNKREHNHYVSVLVVAGDYYPRNGYKLEIRNNLCFNNVTDNANPLEKQNTPDPLSDTSNNIYVKDPIAAGLLLDTIECRLNPAGRAVNGGVANPVVVTDFAGLRRPAGAGQDIGAREYPDASAGPVEPSAMSTAVPAAVATQVATEPPAPPAPPAVATPLPASGSDRRRPGWMIAAGLAVAAGLVLTGWKVFRKPPGRSTVSGGGMEDRRRS